MEREKYIAIGSVVKLEGGETPVMVTGYATVSEEDESKVYDYVGCPYPEGVENQEEVLLFDHRQIQEILYLGYENEEYKRYVEEVKEAVRNYKEPKIEETSKDVLNKEPTKEVGPKIIEETITSYERLG